MRTSVARDWAVRDYRTHLQIVLKRKPATVNNALAAVDDFYTHRGLRPARRGGLPVANDRAIALIPFYAGTRIGELVGLDATTCGSPRARALCGLSGRARRSARLGQPERSHRAERVFGWASPPASPGATVTPVALDAPTISVPELLDLALRR